MGVSGSMLREHYDRVWIRKQGGDGVVPPGTRLDVAARVIGGGVSLLDLGSGGGVFGALVTDRFSRVFALDFSGVAATSARGRGLAAIVADLDRAPLPIRDAAIEAVSCLDVIEHVLGPHVLMREIARLLQPGGRAVVSSPNIQFWRHIWSIVRGRFPRTATDPEGWDGGHLHYFTFGDLEALAAGVGLEVIHREGIINAPRLGRKNRLLQVIFGERFVREFRTFGILLVLRKPIRVATP